MGWSRLWKFHPEPVSAALWAPRAAVAGLIYASSDRALDVGVSLFKNQELESQPCRPSDNWY